MKDYNFLLDKKPLLWLNNEKEIYNEKFMTISEKDMEDAEERLEKFAPFVHGGNIQDIYHEIEEAIYHIERNGNGNVILTDLSIKLTRLLHKKENV